MKTEELETRLREVLRERAERVTERDLRRSTRDPDRVFSTQRAGSRRWQGLAAAAVVLVVIGLVAAGLLGGRDTPTDERVEQVASEPKSPTPGESRVRAWPLTNDDPLPAGARSEDLASPQALARAYLTEVVGLPSDWPIKQVTDHGDSAVADYILQDVPADIRMAKSAEGFWYVTAANTDHARPAAPVLTSGGVDLSLAAGPRTHPQGAPVRVTVLATDGRVLLGARGRVSAPQPEGSGGAAQVWSLQWREPEMAAAVRVDVLDDHDADPSTPEATVGHWTAAISSPLQGLPKGADPTTSAPIFTAPGSPDDVAVAYLRDRFPDYGEPGVELDTARKRGRSFYARWSTSDSGGQIATGVIAVREAGEGYGVVAATTDEVDLSGLEVIQGRVQGGITTRNINSLFADVFQPDGTPAAGSPRPEGQPGAAYRFGTAGGPADGSLEIDVPVEPGSAVVRVNLVGGTILSISEVRLTVPSPSP